MPRPPGSDTSRRVPLALAIVIMTLLAGCNSALIDGATYPPGVNESGVQNATALANAHENRLQKGYRASSTSSVVAGNGSTLVTIESQTRWSSSAANRTVRYTSGHPIFGVYSEIYANDSAVFVRVRQGDGTITTHRLGTDQTRILIPGPNREWETIYGMIGAQQTSATLLDNGTTRIRIRNAELGRGAGNATLYVTEEGLVRHYSATYQSRYLTAPVTFHTRTTYSHVGDPGVVKSDWVANVSASA